MNFIKRLFSKEKEYKWVNITFKETYDISKMPDLSPNSPIKHMSMIYLYRYCPLNDKLMKRYTTKVEWYDVDLESEMNKHEELKSRIYELTVDERRDHIINKILDK